MRLSILLSVYLSVDRLHHRRHHHPHHDHHHSRHQHHHHTIILIIIVVSIMVAISAISQNETESMRPSKHLATAKSRDAQARVGKPQSPSGLGRFPQTP